MAVSQNGYPLLTARTGGALPTLRRWSIPGTGEHVTLRDGSVGFILTHYALWYSECIEPIGGKVLDEWGYSARNIRAAATPSNHWSGSAIDLNATRHPLGVVGTLRFLVAGVRHKGGPPHPRVRAEVRIRRRIKHRYPNAIRWGGDYRGRKDEMHYELAVSLAHAEDIARNLMETPRGKRILAANPGARAAILS